MEGNRRKRNSIIVVSVLAGICLIGTAFTTVAVLRQKNPLAAGLTGLAEEMTAWEAELGENFWPDAIDQIGNGNTQTKYSLNIGGFPELQNVTVGFDGQMRRNMKQQLFTSDIRLSVTNAKIAEASIYGTMDMLFVQVPSIWDGSVVFNTEDVSGQWDSSFVREQLQQLTGRELGIYQRIDAKVLQGVSIEPFSIAGFFRENAESLKALYENMKVIKTEKAQKEGILREDQAESLEGYVLLDADGKQIETTCYLVILPEREAGEVFSNVTGDIRLGVYLDPDKRIVRVCTLPGEVLKTDAGEKKIGFNLTGMEMTIDRLEIMISGVTDAEETVFREFGDGTGVIETECSVVIEAEHDKKGAYSIEGDIKSTYQDNVWELSGAGNIQGEQEKEGKKVLLDVEHLVLRSSNEVVGRFNGNVVFEPLAGNIELPAGKEYYIAEMSEVETLLFLTECTGNMYKNYGGYLKLLQ